MENIKLVDMHDEKNEAKFEDVKGGPAYIKFDGVDGETKDRGHDKWIEIQSVAQPIYR